MYKKLFQHLLFASASGLAISAPAHAEQPAQLTSVQQVNFSIEAQPLSSALKVFTEQSNADLLYSPDLVANKRSKPLSGRHTPAKALQVLLGGTGVSYRQITANSFALQASAEMGNADQGDSSAVSGIIANAATGAGLPGAKISVPGTDLETVTDERGRFYLPAVPTGSSTLLVEYLGQPSQTVDLPSDLDGRRNLAVAVGETSKEIVVLGYRSSLARALNQQLRAPNNQTVVSADLLGSFPAETVSEALRRVPGVAFGRADDTGEGSRISIRGFSSEAINIQLNGLGLQGTGFERTIDLSDFLAENISQITIQKSLLPSHEANSSGGLVEIETKSGLDYGDFAFNFGIEGETNFDRDFGGEYQINGTLAKQITPDFGVVATVQYRKTDRTNYSVDLVGALPPVLPAGFTSVTLVPASQKFPFDPELNKQLVTGASYLRRDRDEKDLTASLNFAWNVSSSTRLRLDLQRIQGWKETATARTTASFLTTAVDMPIEELGGEVRRRTTLASLRPNIAHGLVDINSYSDTISFRGDTTLDRWEFKYKAGYSRARSKSNNSNISILGNTNTNLAAIIDPATAVINPDDDAAMTPRFVDGGVIFLGNGLPVLSLTDAGSQFLNDPNNYNITSLNRTLTNSPTESWQFEGSARYQPPMDWFSYIEIGGKYDTSSRKSADDLFASTSVGSLSSVISYLRIAGRDTSLAFFGDGLLDTGFLNDIGGSGFQVPFLRADAVQTLFDGADALLVDDPNTAFNEQRFNFTDNRDLDPVQNAAAQTPAKTRERVMAGYVETKFEFGNFELIGGVRMERFNRSGTTLTAPSVRTAANVLEPRETFITAGLVSFDTLSGTQSTWTPSFLLNYRPADNIVARFSYNKTTVNPSFQLLRRPAQVFVDLRPTVNRVTLREANPDLKATKTDNYDFDVAYYFDDTPGLVRLGVFYKKITNNFTNVFFQDAPDQSTRDDVIAYFGDLANSRPEFVAFDANTEFLRNRPINGEGGDIWGIEAEIIRQLTFLPGFLKDFGVLANVTYTNGDFPTLVSGRNDDGTVGQFTLNRALEDEFEWVYNLSLNYSKGGFEGRIIYTHQDASVQSFEVHGLDTVVPAYSTLDLRLSYNFEAAGGDWTVFLQGDDLLRGSKEVDLRAAISSEFNSGSADFYYPDIYQFNGGRSVSFGIRGRF